MKSVLDPSFRYTNSANTDLRKTFARIRREQRRHTPAGASGPTVSPPTAVTIDRRKVGV